MQRNTDQSEFRLLRQYMFIFQLILASTAFIFHLIGLLIVMVPFKEISDAFGVRIVGRIV